MKNNLILVIVTVFLVLSCTRKTVGQPTQEKDSLTTDTAYVIIDSIKKDSVPIYIEQDAYDNKADIAKTEFLRLKKSADSLYNITLALSNLESQYTAIIQTGKYDYEQLDRKKITLSTYKQKLKTNLERKIVNKSYDSEVIPMPIFTDADSSRDRFTVYLGIIDKIEVEIIPDLKAKEIEIARSVLHKKLIVANAQYYLNITIRNPSQDKFLKGWTRRAWSQ